MIVRFDFLDCASSSSAFDMMVALTRFFLPWVPHTWMSGANSLQTPRAWFWGTHKWAISAALLADGVSRTVGSVLVFGPPLHRGIVRRSLRQSSWDGYSVCSDMSGKHSRDVVDVQEKECRWNDSSLWDSFSHFHAFAQMAIQFYSGRSVL